MTLRQVSAVAVPPGARPGFDHADVYHSARTSRMYVAHTGAIAHTIGWDPERKELSAFAPRASTALVFADVD